MGAKSLNYAYRLVRRRCLYPRGPHNALEAFFVARRRHVRDILRRHHACDAPTYVGDEMASYHIRRETTVERRT